MEQLNQNRKAFKYRALLYFITTMTTKQSRQVKRHHLGGFIFNLGHGGSPLKGGFKKLRR